MWMFEFRVIPVFTRTRAWQIGDESSEHMPKHGQATNDSGKAFESGYCLFVRTMWLFV